MEQMHLFDDDAPPRFVCACQTCRYSRRATGQPCVTQYAGPDAIFPRYVPIGRGLPVEYGPVRACDWVRDWWHLSWLVQRGGQLLDTEVIGVSLCSTGW